MGKILGKHFRYIKINNDIFPWRFNFFVSKKKERDNKIKNVWKNHGHANRLYPSIPKFLFGHKKKFLGSEYIENSIVNLPLNENFSLSDITKNAKLILEIFKK